MVSSITALASLALAIQVGIINADAAAVATPSPPGQHWPPFWPYPTQPASTAPVTTKPVTTPPVTSKPYTIQPTTKPVNVTTAPTPTLPTCVHYACLVSPVCATKFDARTNITADVTYNSSCDLEYDQCVFGYQFTAIKSGVCREGARLWQRCGGKGWDGPTFCKPGEGVCVYGNEFYSQCQPDTPAPNSVGPNKTVTPQPTSIAPVTPQPTSIAPNKTSPVPTQPACVLQACHAQQVCGTRFDPKTGVTVQITYASTCEVTYEQCLHGYQFPAIHGGPCQGGALIWERCGGIGWDGPTYCNPGQGVCTVGNEYYSQCQPATAAPATPAPATTAPATHPPFTLPPNVPIFIDPNTSAPSST